MALNGISTLSTKEAKQVAKLNLASLKRQGYTLNPDGTIASGPDPSKNFFRSRDSYDITELPTEYSGNDVVDNPNPDGLIQGRPWVTGGMVEGFLWRTQYTQTYYEFGTSIYDSPSLSSEAVEGFILPETVPEYSTVEFRGYFRANWTGTWRI